MIARPYLTGPPPLNKKLLRTTTFKKSKFLTSLKREKCCRIRLINPTITQRRISIRPARPAAAAAAVIITQRGVRAVPLFFPAHDLI
jgi:hypothetical protein